MELDRHGELTTSRSEVKGFRDGNGIGRSDPVSLLFLCVLDPVDGLIRSQDCIGTSVATMDGQPPCLSS